jgi:hypothetical protein
MVSAVSFFWQLKSAAHIARIDSMFFFMIVNVLRFFAVAQNDSKMFWITVYLPDSLVFINDFIASTKKTLRLHLQNLGFRRLIIKRMQFHYSFWFGSLPTPRAVMGRQRKCEVDCLIDRRLW